jgi:phospholipid-binding lipoprotein MlaA
MPATIPNIIASTAVVLLCGCASTNPSQAEEEIRDPGFYEERMPNIDFMEVYDPWEGFNRRVYDFNYQFDRFVFLPAVRGYRAVTPKALRTGVTNFWSNLAEVETAAASLLQFRFQKVARGTGRFLVNSVLGIGGLFDVATPMGIIKVNEDFGQTFGHWGIPPGPYLVVPFLGPSSVRDGIGLVADQAVARAVNVGRVPEDRSEKLAVGAFYAVSTREAVPFRYGQLKSPFEYEMVRFAITKARQTLVEE